MRKVIVSLICVFSSILFSVATIGVYSLKTSNIEPVVSSSVEIVNAATANIRDVQTRLKKWGYYTGVVDGINGPKTIAAVKKFQKKYGLTQDGIVGPLTAAKMGLSVSGGNKTSGSNFNSNDRYMLAKVIYAEARGESYTGQVAIGAVVLNRVRDSRFPNTVSGVIYQPWAFTAVHDGQFDLEPNATAYQAARDALNGWDPTYGSLYYYNPNTATNTWIRSRKVTTTIGEHVFAI